MNRVLTGGEHENPYPQVSFTAVFHATIIQSSSRPRSLEHYVRARAFHIHDYLCVSCQCATYLAGQWTGISPFPFFVPYNEYIFSRSRG